MASMEELIEARTASAVASAVRPLQKEIAALRRAVAELAEATKAANESFDPRERLITQKEAMKRLGVNFTRFQAMAKDGAVVVVSTPNGRNKVVESSLNSYIGSLRKKAGWKEGERGDKGNARKAAFSAFRAFGDGVE